MTNKKNVYVVTRNFRRIEERNYTDKADADIRAENLVQVLKKWRDPDLKKVKVLETSNPYKIK